MLVDYTAGPVTDRLPSLLVALALSGCGKLDRVGDCRALAGTVNPTLDRIESEVRSKSPASYRKAAKEYRGLAERLRKEPPTKLGPAKALTDEYASLIAEAEPPLMAYAAALESKTPPENATRELDQLSRRERTLVTRIEHYCAGR